MEPWLSGAPGNSSGARTSPQGGGTLLVRGPDLFWPPPTAVSAAVHKGRGLRWEGTPVPLLPAGPVLHPFLCLQPS